MTHDEQWDAVIQHFKRMWHRAETTREVLDVTNRLNEAARARKAGENPIIWKLENG